MARTVATVVISGTLLFLAILTVLGLLRILAAHAPINCTQADWLGEADYYPYGQPITSPAEARYLRIEYGDRMVDHCWPGTPR